MAKFCFTSVGIAMLKRALGPPTEAEVTRCWALLCPWIQVSWTEILILLPSRSRVRRNESFVQNQYINTVPWTCTMISTSIPIHMDTQMRRYHGARYVQYDTGTLRSSNPLRSIKHEAVFHICNLLPWERNVLGARETESPKFRALIGPRRSSETGPVLLFCNLSRVPFCTPATLL